MSEQTKRGLLGIILREGGARAEAEALSEQLQVPVHLEMSEEQGLYLVLSGEGLSLTDGNQEMRGDFTKNMKRLTHANLSHELLVKAAKLKGRTDEPVLLDATAGMGEDSLLLAAAGFRVIMCEYNPVIAALLLDTVERAKKTEELREIASRMEVYQGDSVQKMHSLTRCPDVILLDPMFPEKQKSALVKKKFQLLHGLELPCMQEEALLSAALQLKPAKVVVKRPAKGEYLAGKKPDYSLTGSAIRYDIFRFQV